LVEETSFDQTSGCPARKPLNDYTLRTAGMNFPGFWNLASFLALPTGCGNWHLLHNHSTISHSEVANSLLSYPLYAQKQYENKR
jgi:hypothetical protein